jgi:predicted GNAT family acetyltransferase
MAITVVRDDAHHRYQALVDGEPAGAAHYRERPGVLTFYHTVVDEAFEGKGVGSALAKGALDDVRARGERIVVECPFITTFLKRHPEYADLVTESSGPVGG